MHAYLLTYLLTYFYLFTYLFAYLLHTVTVIDIVSNPIVSSTNAMYTVSPFVRWQFLIYLFNLLVNLFVFISLTQNSDCIPFILYATEARYLYQQGIVWNF